MFRFTAASTHNTNLYAPRDTLVPHTIRKCKQPSIMSCQTPLIMCSLTICLPRGSRLSSTPTTNKKHTYFQVVCPKWPLPLVTWQWTNEKVVITYVWQHVRKLWRPSFRNELFYAKSAGSSYWRLATVSPRRVVGKYTSVMCCDVLWSSLELRS